MVNSVGVGWMGGVEHFRDKGGKNMIGSCSESLGERIPGITNSV